MMSRLFVAHLALLAGCSLCDANGVQLDRGEYEVVEVSPDEEPPLAVETVEVTRSTVIVTLASGEELVLDRDN